MTLQCLDCQCFNYCKYANIDKDECGVFKPIDDKEDSYTGEKE